MSQYEFDSNVNHFPLIELGPHFLYIQHNNEKTIAFVILVDHLVELNNFEYNRPISSFGSNSYRWIKGEPYFSLGRLQRRDGIQSCYLSRTTFLYRNNHLYVSRRTTPSQSNHYGGNHRYRAILEIINDPSVPRHIRQQYSKLRCRVFHCHSYDQNIYIAARDNITADTVKIMSLMDVIHSTRYSYHRWCRELEIDPNENSSNE
eukprot:gb/GECH01005671.1/.p1 GENE.gb/GECH01005671.1/~~gb/GECH01005671.1/.p1  ORF type:complete len:204 (+),score=12.10 gb/GECH01005671.1/:1-612(+)